MGVFGSRPGRREDGCAGAPGAAAADELRTEDAAAAARRLAGEAALEIEGRCASGTAEVVITAELVLVLRRPSLKSAVAGVLLQGDLATVRLDRSGLAGQVYLLMDAASSIRKKNDMQVFFKPGTACWLCCALPGSSSCLVEAITPPVEVGVVPLREEVALASIGAPAVPKGPPAAGRETLEPAVASSPGGQGGQAQAPEAAAVQESPAAPAGPVALGEPRVRPGGAAASAGARAAQGRIALRETARVGADTGVQGDAAKVGRILKRWPDWFPFSLHRLLLARRYLQRPRPTPPPGKTPRPGQQIATAEAEARSGPQEFASAGASAPDDEAKAERRPVAFFGICDLKYDKWRPPGECVKVLELGDGCTSQFSGSGAHIPEKFERSYRLLRPINRATLVNHKALTHRVFKDCGLLHLRPKQVCFERVYRLSLAAMIFDRLGLPPEDGEVVLKLCNCCRGVGIVVARGRADLDARLRELLQVDRSLPPPRSLDEAMDSDPDSMREHVLHWWSNECPCFVAEQRITMERGVAEDGSAGGDGADVYDATMRAAFVLTQKAECSDEDEAFEVEFLGAYWKLPRAPQSSPDIRARCVSKAQQSTAPVAMEDSAEVYQALGRALCRVFGASRASASFIARLYKTEPLNCAFTLARHAAEQTKREIRERERAQASGREYRASPSREAQTAEHLATAEGKLAVRYGANAPDRLPAGPVHSYISRQRGVAATRHDWDKALRCWQAALKEHPLNASAHYLVGVYHLRREDHRRALGCFMRSVQLDPDFKAVYANLGAVCLALKDYDGAAACSRRGLGRHPKAYQCSFNLAVASVHQLVALLDGGEEEAAGLEGGALVTPSAALALARAAAERLRAVRQLRRGRSRSEWAEPEERLLGDLEEVCQALGAVGRSPDWWAWPRRTLDDALHPLRGVRGWTLTNFRP